MPGFLLDLDGTLYHGDRPIPHAADFVASLRKEGNPFLFVTNNSSREPEQVAAHLRATGIDARPEEVLTSSQAAALFVREQQWGDRVYCIGEAGLRAELRRCGFILQDETAAGVEAGTADAVVQGIDRSFDYAKLLAAVRHIRAGARYVLTNPDHLLPWNGELTPGAGSIAAAIERAAECAPVVIGKPSPIIMRYAIARLGLDARDIWVVGDNLRTDIAGGANAGCRTALVLTGLVAERDAAERLRESAVQPDLVCRDLADLRAQLS
ncbi:HAD-IIA family hydrolase [Paenibacillus ginsengihumi]|uniref:HAD-IIA family hydrolase n=1 Tax=Paenibacillus ginsengihumi TaxID=431596 RepID=UPI00036121BC|nr:HAD-IIA family hydrolase [Paenibacillus ginsengihumi]